MALSIAPVDNPFEPVVVRGRVVECGGQLTEAG